MYKDLVGRLDPRVIDYQRRIDAKKAAWEQTMRELEMHPPVERSAEETAELKARLARLEAS